MKRAIGRVVTGILFYYSTDNQICFRRRLRSTNAFAQTRDGVHSMTAQIQIRKVQAERYQHLRLNSVLQVRRGLEAGGQNTHNIPGSASNSDGLIEDVGIGAEMTLPKVVTQHHYVGSALVVLSRNEGAAAFGLDSQQGEKIVRHSGDAHSLGLACASERQRSTLVCAYLSETLAFVTQPHKFHRSQASLRKTGRRQSVVDLHQVIRLLVWQRAQDHRVDNAEDRGVRANTQRQGEYCDSREAGSLKQASNTEPNVSE